MNILLITTDTQRCDTLRCMGYDFAHSPHTDRLAAEGVLFNQAHTSSPVCSPARTSLLTGVHAPIHGAIENGIKPRRDLTPFTDLLAEAGYTNIMAGKTHFGPLPESFHIDFSTSGGKKPGPDDIYTQNLRAHGLERNAGYPHDIPDELFYDAFVTDRTIEGIRQARKKGAPFFAFCSMVSPHGPLDPPGTWGDLYTDDGLPPFPRYPDVSGEPAHTRRLLGLDGQPRRSESEINTRRRLYYGLSAYCDHQVGRLLDFLDAEGLREETLVIFTSDHGTDLYEHGFDDKHHWYDNTWRIPLVLSQPGVLPQGETRDFAVWTDLTATILGAAGIDAPAVQGFDLFTPLRAGEASPRACAVGTVYKSCALATQRWKLEYFLEEGQARLFDRRNDPGEYNDLAGSPTHAPLLAALKEALLAWRSDLQDIAFLHAHTGRGGGHVSTRLADISFARRGTDAESRLNARAQSIDQRFARLP